MKRSILFVVLLSLAAALAAAATRPLYRISLSDGTSVLSKDRPVQRGSILLFHAYPKGALTGLPEESVVGVMPATQASVDELTVSAAPVLEPGEVVFLPPLAGDRSTTATSALAPSAAPSIPGGVYDPRNPAYGYAPPRTGGAQALLPSGAIAPGDLARAISATPPTTEVPFGSNGIPVTPGTQTLAIGPDGLPILIQAGAPGSTPPPIGPNGTPVMAPAGAPGSTPPSIGPNGTPVLAPSGMPGSAPPPVGPNGFPAPGGPGG
jgi:hypothetical protein